ncbi:MAG: hypothetical protein K2N74_00655, partial [Clostridiales bacterium]|nr:hypothetical protein [Clostridiales bacterium]
MQNLSVKRFIPHGELSVDVPASKSILNRALILAALARGTVKLQCGSLCEDTRALLNCLLALGVQIEQRHDGFTVRGCGGDFPVKNACLNVQSAGTAARFLPAVLAFCGGEYTFTASEQMQKRPMDLLKTLSELGTEITFLKDDGHFPFRLRSAGITAKKIEVQTDVSTQFASGLLLAGAVSPLTLVLRGERTAGSYVEMTFQMLRAFGATVERNGDEITVFPAEKSPDSYNVEGDFSGACYFCALALLLHVKIFIRSASLIGVQGDLQFINLLQEKGLRLMQTEQGLLADGEQVTSFTGFDADFRDFSDQTMTAAALAPFATTPSILKNV